MKDSLPAFFDKYKSLQKKRGGSGGGIIGDRTRGTRQINSGRWCAYRCVNGKQVSLGVFDTQEEAFIASQKARGLSY